MRFEMPLPDKIWSTNEDRNLHHMARHARVKAWRDATVFHFRIRVGRDINRAQPPGLVQIYLPVKSTKQRRDPHNYCGTVLKAVIDGLVAGGAWPDDTPEFVGHREPVFHEGKTVIIEITPMGERNPTQ